MLNNQKEIVLRLLNIDYELKRLGTRENKKPLDLIIFGGAAVLLLTGDVRATHDVDAYIENEPTAEERRLLEEYGVNDRLSIGVVPDDFRDRAKPLNIETDHIRVFVADPLDVILHKLLNRGDSRDRQDVYQLMDQVDLDQLREMYNEYRNYTIGHDVRFIIIEDLIEDYLESRKDKSG